MPATFHRIHSPISGAILPARLGHPYYGAWSIGSLDPPVDLAVMIHAYRVWTGVSPGQVLAVIEYVNPATGQVDYEVGRSTYGHGHAEEDAYHLLVNRHPAWHAPGDLITRVYVEMEPCGQAVHDCHQLLADNAPYAVVMYGAPFPQDYTNRKDANKRMYDSRDRQERFVRQKLERVVERHASGSSTVQ